MHVREFAYARACDHIVTVCMYTYYARVYMRVRLSAWECVRKCERMCLSVRARVRAPVRACVRAHDICVFMSAFVGVCANQICVRAGVLIYTCVCLRARARA